MRTYNLWVLVRPAEDLKDQWVAHCLELDVVSQGTSFTHAMEMVFEAIAMVVTDDIGAGRDPLSRRAPEEYWSELYHVMEEGN
jgi:predicted RNase H-like HicB family nuclease